MPRRKIPELDIIEQLFYNKGEVIYMDIHAYWRSVLEQDRTALPDFFWENARVNWHNTNECFTVPEFIRANCDYPGTWEGKVERIIEQGDLIITVTHVYNRERTISFHAVSFLHIRDGKIQEVDEYWGDDGAPPAWRQEMHIGSVIGTAGGFDHGI